MSNILLLSLEHFTKILSFSIFLLYFTEICLEFSYFTQHLVSVHFILAADPVQQLSADLNARHCCQDPAVLLGLRGQPAQQHHLKMGQDTLNRIISVLVIYTLITNSKIWVYTDRSYFHLW